MEEIHQKGVILSHFQLKKSNNEAVSRFLPVKDDQWQYRIDGPSISFWRPEQSVPFDGWRFNDGSKIVAACSMPFADGSSGVVLGVNDFGGSKPVYFLAYYSFAKSSVVKMITVKNEITCILVLIGNMDRAQMAELNPGLSSAPHWIAVGTKGGSCYLTHFNIDSPSEVDLHISPPVFSTNVSKNYVRDDSFVVDTAQGNFAIKLDKVSVTALSYVPKCWLLLIGLSCGAVISVGISAAATRLMYYMYDGPVRSFAWQEPNDDPRPTFYLWIAHDASERKRTKNLRISGPQVLLTIIVFPDDEGKPFHEWTYRSPRIQRHFAWSPGSISRWVSLRTIVQHDSLDRISRMGDRSNTFEESSVGSTSPDSTLLLMVWVNQRETAVQGALFDLNAFYYKRLVKSVIFDETIAHQCPFLSLFTLLDTKSEAANIQDVIACSEFFIRFSGPLSESNDALFYPSALSFSVVVLKNDARLVVEVRSIQDQVLETIESDIVDAVGGNVNLAAQWMTAVGLADANCTFAMNTEWYEPSLIITGLLNHDRISGLRKWLEEFADEASRDDFTKFLWDFVQDTKEHFDENSSGLFAKISTVPPKWTISWLKSAFFVFSNAEELFGVVHAKMNSKDGTQDAEVECHRRASSNLALYTRLVLFMLKQNILPESTNYGNIWAKLKQSVDERYAKAQSARKQLFIHELLEEVKRFGEGEGFWAGEGSLTLYPPKTLLILFDPVLALQITTAAKLKLMGYFILDYDSITEKIKKTAANAMSLISSTQAPPLIPLFSRVGLYCESTHFCLYPNYDSSSVIILHFQRKVFVAFRNMFLANDPYLADQIAAKYESDLTVEPSQSTTDMYKEMCQRSEEPANYRKLMKCPLLDDAQYEIIRKSVLKEKDGITVWNDFCIARQQLQRLIEPTKEMKNEEWKNVCDQWARRFLREIPRLDSSSLPHRVAEKWRSARDSPPKTDLVCVTRRRPKRRTTLHETLVEFRSAMELRKRKARMDDSPERKGLQTPELDRTFSIISQQISPVGDNDAMQLERILPKENLERVRRILQTPPSVRRRGHLPRGGLPLNLDLTPENIAVIQPTSILKSAAKRRLHGDTEQGIQPRLRFDLPGSDMESTTVSASDNDTVNDEYSEEVDDVVAMEDEAIPSTSNFEDEIPGQTHRLSESILNESNRKSENVTAEEQSKEDFAKSKTFDIMKCSDFSSSPIKTRKVVKESCCEMVVGMNLGANFAEDVAKNLLENYRSYGDTGNELKGDERMEESAELPGSSLKSNLVPTISLQKLSDTEDVIEEKDYDNSHLSKTSSLESKINLSLEKEEEKKIEEGKDLVIEKIKERKVEEEKKEEKNVERKNVEQIENEEIGRRTGKILQEQEDKREHLKKDEQELIAHDESSQFVQSITGQKLKAAVKNMPVVGSPITKPEQGNAGICSASELPVSVETPRRRGRSRAYSTSSYTTTFEETESKRHSVSHSSSRTLPIKNETSVKRKRMRTVSSSLTRESSEQDYVGERDLLSTPKNSPSGRRYELRSASKAVSEPESERDLAFRPDSPEKFLERKRGRTGSRSPSRSTRATSVLSTASAPEVSSNHAASRSPLKTASKRGRRATSEVPVGPTVQPKSTRSRRRIAASDNEPGTSSRTRPSRIRAGRKTVDQVLKTIEEETKDTPTRNSSRTRKTPTRYPF